MPLSSIQIQTPKTQPENLFFQYFAVLLASLSLAGLLSGPWVIYTNVCHSIIELICLFIASSVFIIVWHTYDKNSLANKVIGFGFLAVAIYNVFHIYHFPWFNFYPEGFYDLAFWYWHLGKITEAALFIIITFDLVRRGTGKWAGAAISLSVSLGVSMLVLNSQGVLPVLRTGEGNLTTESLIIELLIIAVFLICLYHMKNKINDSSTLTYRYVYMALLIAVPAELCFIMFTSITSFSYAFGHILKTAYYYYLFRGIFISSVTYPHIKLEEAGRYMNDLLNGLPIGLTTFDERMRLTFANKMAEEIFGCKKEDILGLTVFQIDRKFMKEDSFGGQVSEKSTSLVNRIITIRNSNGIDIKLSVAFQKLRNGGCMYLFTEAKKEQELESLKLQTQTILNSVSNTVALFDGRSKLIMCNKAFETVLGMDAGHIIGMEIKELNNLLQLKSKKHIKDWPGSSKKDYQHEISLVTPRGDRKEFILHTDVIRNLDGEIIGRISVGSDITDLKWEQRKIQQQEKLMMLGEMAAGVVHEIRNPLTSIKGFSQIIMAREKDKQIKEYAHIIEKNANSVGKVVSDFLTFAKPRIPVLQELSVNQLIKSMTPDLESQFKEKGITGKYVFASGEKVIMADEAQVRQVLNSIVSNAVDAMAESENPCLTIGTSFMEKRGEILITISDNGKGMFTEELLKAGTPFFTTKDNGTGLGLCICYQIVKEHGGRIDIESQPGKGTSFTISLPCRMPSSKMIALGEKSFYNIGKSCSIS
ncbi:MAG: MASE3 domain-containing protein [Bacillota bacterium]